MFNNPKELDFNKELNLTIAKVMDEYIDNIELTRTKSLSRTHIEYLKWDFADRMKDEFKDSMNKAMRWKLDEMPADKKAYFESIANLHNKNIPKSKIEDFDPEGYDSYRNTGTDN